MLTTLFEYVFTSEVGNLNPFTEYECDCMSVWLWGRAVDLICIQIHLNDCIQLMSFLKKQCKFYY